MEIIVTLAVLALAGYWIYDMSQKKNKTDDPKADGANLSGILGALGQKLNEHNAAQVGLTAPGKSADDRVEATPPKCGCGRSESGFCVGLHKLTPEEWAVSDKNPNRATEVTNVTADNKAKAKRAPAKKTADKKPAAKRAPAKKKST